jgi:hypothetical protein
MLGWIGPRFSELTPLASLAVRVGLCLTGVVRGLDGASLFRISVTMKILLSGRILAEDDEVGVCVRLNTGIL